MVWLVVLAFVLILGLGTLLETALWIIAAVAAAVLIAAVLLRRFLAR